MVTNDRANYDAALHRQRRAQVEADFAAGRVRPVPYRITQALDLHSLDGPEVDIACGGAEPMVDEWEAGERVPTLDQLRKLAKLTQFPIDYFFRPAPERSGTAFLCSSSGPRGRRCQTIQLGPRPTAQPPAPIAEVIPMPSREPAARPGTPGWRCLVPYCRTRGRRHAAVTEEAALAALADHYQHVHGGR
ncbi:helix-turn-helix domain-containing protein [Nonomuraea glycinis]|uniref:helix-turn-helix domain-containing protein n=1 Tax=Nonomuraea glycinis TaxID=2047744 RepID=UPI00339DD90D